MYLRAPFALRPALTSIVLLIGLLIAQLSFAHGTAGARGRSGSVEPNAGTWKTWVLSSGSELRLPAPPSRAATQAELRQLQALVSQRPAAQDTIAYWTSGGPAYRWNELALEAALKNGVSTPPGSRVFALLNVAIYDATIAAWDTKYTYNRPRPSVQFPALRTAAPVPASPSYPSEHAVVAGAAAGVLSYLFPKDASLFDERAAEAGQAMLVAGLQYPSDVQSGYELGRAVAARVIEHAKNDGSSAQWTGTVPSGPGLWSGTNPALPMGGTWKTWVLSTGSQLRPGPPPAYDSPQMAAEMDELRAFQRTPQTNSTALFWEYGAGGARLYAFWNELLSRKVLEHGLSDNPPRAARAFALPNIAMYDAFVACWDAKYTYWSMRPFQLDPGFKPLFAAPNHPSFPSAHSCFSQSVSATMAYLFPGEAGRFYALADGASESRISSGIHFRSDVQVGRDLGWEVGQHVIARAKADGSH